MEIAGGLRELYSLYRCGALTYEEYQDAKRVVLSTASAPFGGVTAPLPAVQSLPPAPPIEAVPPAPSLPQETPPLLHAEIPLEAKPIEREVAQPRRVSQSPPSFQRCADLMDEASKLIGRLERDALPDPEPVKVESIAHYAAPLPTVLPESERERQFVPQIALPQAGPVVPLQQFSDPLEEAARTRAVAVSKFEQAIANDLALLKSAAEGMKTTSAGPLPPPPLSPEPSSFVAGHVVDEAQALPPAPVLSFEASYLKHLDAAGSVSPERSVSLHKSISAAQRLRIPQEDPVPSVAPSMLWDTALCRGVHVSADAREATCTGGVEGAVSHVMVGTSPFDPFVVRALPQRTFEWSVVLLLRTANCKEVLVGMTGRGVAGTATYVLRGDGCALSEQPNGTHVAQHYSPPLGELSQRGITTVCVTCRIVDSTLSFNVDGMV